MTRQEVIKKSREIATHEKVVAEYNKISPLPVGYKLKLSDDWCAAFVTVVLHLCKYDKLNECSVPRMIALAKKHGIYKDKSYKPKEGDVIVFDWDDTKDGDHVGIITKVNGNLIITREGNVSNDFCDRHIYTDDKRITCYFAIPYEDEKVKEKIYSTVDDIVNGIIRGDFGNGSERKENLYNYFQKKVNEKFS